MTGILLTIWYGKIIKILSMESFDRDYCIMKLHQYQFSFTFLNLRVHQLWLLIFGSNTSLFYSQNEGQLFQFIMWIFFYSREPLENNIVATKDNRLKIMVTDSKWHHHRVIWAWFWSFALTKIPPSTTSTPEKPLFCDFFKHSNLKKLNFLTLNLLKPFQYFKVWKC